MKCCKSRKASSLLNSWGINFNHWNRIFFFFSVSLANLTFFCFSPRRFDVLLRMKSITVQLQFIKDLVLARWEKLFHSVLQAKELPHPTTSLSLFGFFSCIFIEGFLVNQMHRIEIQLSSFPECPLLPLLKTKKVLYIIYTI